MVWRIQSIQLESQIAYASAQAFAALPKVSLAALSAPWAQLGRPLARLPPARLGGSFLLLFRAFCLVRVPMGSGPFAARCHGWLKPLIGEVIPASIEVSLFGHS